MKFTYKIALNYSTMEFEIDAQDIESYKGEIAAASKLLASLAKESKDAPSPAPKGSKLPPKRPVTDGQRRCLRANGYTDQDVDLMSFKDASNLIAKIKSQQEEDAYYGDEF